MRSEDTSFIAGLLIGVMLSGVMIMAIAAPAVDFRWKSKAVKMGFAEYSTTTGKWQWKGDSSSESRPETGPAASQTQP